jgi:hypothetical protein
MRGWAKLVIVIDRRCLAGGGHSAWSVMVSTTEGIQTKLAQFLISISRTQARIQDVSKSYM